MRRFLAKLSTALVAYGPAGVFLLAVLDSVGVPLPAAMDLLLLDIAVHSTHDPGRAWFSASLAVVGSLIGNIGLFQAVRHGSRLVRRQGKEAESGRFREWFRRYGLLTVFVPAAVPFIPLPLKVFVISAALFHTRFDRFVTVIVTARVMRYFFLSWLALQLGADARGFLTRNGHWLAVGTVAFALLVYLLMRWTERHRLRESPLAVKAGGQIVP